MGLGATIGPYIMGFALTGGMTWNGGYRIISMIQIVLTNLLVVSLPLWKGKNSLVLFGKFPGSAQRSFYKEYLRIQVQKSDGLLFLLLRG